ncbi:MAG: glycosyltransferase [Pyrinomonadaceae bacterium]
MNQNNIKSVHITNYYHKDSGGISTAYNKLLEAANRRGRYVRLIVPGEHSSVEEIGEFGRIYYVKSGYSPVFDKRYRLMLPWNAYIPDGSPIKAILRDEQPDLIEIGEKYTLSLMAGLMRKGILNVSPKRPILVHTSCERMDDNVSSFIAKGRLINWFTRRYMGNYNIPMFDFHLANSSYTGQEILDAASSGTNPNRSNAFFNFCWRLLRAPKIALKDRLFVNQCGVDNELFSISRQNEETRRTLIAEYDLPSDATMLLYAGRISPEKNIGLLPKMMQKLAGDKLRNYKLIVAGSGPATETLAMECENLAPSSVKILGQISDRERLADLFANCDAFVHPNPREPFGITPLEAMASGLPVVAPNAGGILSYATSKNSWLADPAGESFALAVHEVFSDNLERAKRIDSALKTSAKYTWESSTDAMFALYDRMYAEFNENPDLFDYENSATGIDFARLCST